MKILLIEDDQKTLASLQKGLAEHGLSVEGASDGITGLHVAQSGEFDLILLDVMLPKMDGWAVLEQYRLTHKQVPVIMLTACDEIEERVKGLELGADDYLVKPYAFVELVARIQSLLRRTQNGDARGSGHLMQIADLTVDLQRMKVWRNRHEIALSAKEFTLLVYMMRNKGRVLSRMMIAEHVWDINFRSDANIIEVAIKRLRNKVDKPFGLPLIHTQRGLGYVLEER